MTGHVNKGKRGMNLDEYTSRNLRYQYHKMEDVIEQLKEGDMPLNSYTWIHKDAILTPAEKKTLTD
jgi:DNA replicative helicase MCM subunit Mcm2 (Cdc46/Mcm family)